MGLIRPASFQARHVARRICFGQVQTARRLSNNAGQPQHFEAPVPVGKNLVVAGALGAFVTSVYLYTVKRMHTNTELGDEFTQVFEQEGKKEESK